MKTNQEVADEIRVIIEHLNSKMIEAEKHGIVVVLSSNSACIGSDAPAIQAEIYERINL